MIARLVGQKLTERLGQPVVIENRAGANTILGTEFVAKAPPDGYTILCAAAASVVINPAIYSKLRYSIADFAPLSNAASYPFILSVAKYVPAQNLRELVDYIKKNPDKANAGGSTAGHQLMTALFREKTGAPVQYIPYKGMNEVSAALAGDQLMMSFLTAANAGQINSGAVRALAVTSATRDPRFPNVPTTAEAGVDGFIALSWAGFLAPARTPPAIVNKLSSEIAAAVKLPEMREKLLAANLDPVGSTPESSPERLPTTSRPGPRSRRPPISRSISRLGRQTWTTDLDDRLGRQTRTKELPRHQTRGLIGRPHVHSLQIAKRLRPQAHAVA